MNWLWLTKGMVTLAGAAQFYMHGTWKIAAVIAVIALSDFAWAAA